MNKDICTSDVQSIDRRIDNTLVIHAKLAYLAKKEKEHATTPAEAPFAL